MTEELARLCLEYIRERASIPDQTDEAVKQSLRLIHTWASVALDRLEEENRSDRPNIQNPPMVRVRRLFSGCEILGPMVSETAISYSYQTEEKGKVNKQGIRVSRIKKNQQARSAGFPAPAPHIVPCLSCPDHPESHYVSRPNDPRCSIHGNAAPRNGIGCETCAST